MFNHCVLQIVVQKWQLLFTLQVKSEINSAFSQAVNLLKNREAFLLNCVDDNVKAVSEFIAKMEQQSSRSEMLFSID